MTSPSPSEPRTGQQLYHGAPFTPATAAKVTAAAIATIYVSQIVLVNLGTIDLVASVVSDVLAIAVVLVFARRHGVRAADLGLRGAPARFIAAAVLVGISAWYVTMWLVVLIDPPGDPTKLQGLIERTPLAPTLFALTVMPGIAEELVFRGVLVRSLAGRFFPIAAIGIGAFVFAVYHIFPPQMLSTFVLGIMLGFLALRSRSIVPPMIVHVLNNTVAVLLVRDELPGASTVLGAYPLVTLAAAVVIVSLGLGLAAKGVA